jgi:hypothetical protein
MMLVVLAYRAVLPADLPVLFGILNNRFAGAKHTLVRWSMINNRVYDQIFCFFIMKNNPCPLIILPQEHVSPPLSLP